MQNVSNLQIFLQLFFILSEKTSKIREKSSLPIDREVGFSYSSNRLPVTLRY